MEYFKKYLAVILLLLLVTPLLAQRGVGINTTQLDDGSALQVESTTGSVVIPRMTNGEMQAIDGPLEGSLVFSITDNSLYIRIGQAWVKYVQLNDTPSLILNKNGGQLVLQDNPPLPLPLNSDDVLHNVTDYYEVLGDATVPKNSTIKILQGGLYLVSAAMSTSNLPSGPKKYKLLVFVNGVLNSYLTSGNVNLSSSDFWGTSGNSVLLLEKDDIVEIKYTLDGTETITARFFNISISKL